MAVFPQVVLMMACIPYTASWALAAAAGSLHSVPLLYTSRCHPPLLRSTSPG